MRLLCAMAVAALAATSMGCQSVRSAGQPAHLTTLANAPRPENIRTVGFAGGCGCDACGDTCDSGCCGSCCDSGCCDSGCCDSGCCGGNRCINGIVGGLLDCAPGHCGAGNCLGGRDAAYNFTPGPVAAQTAYPYYTVRGPRDFLARNPRSIGPTGGY